MAPRHYPDLLDRIADRFTIGDGCWIWRAGKSGRYGAVRRGGRNVGAHVVLYELIIGPVPAGKHLHHECEEPLCVRPDHLTPKTPGEHSSEHDHTSAVEAAARVRRARTHCPHGHEFTEENTLRNSKGARVCRMCNREKTRRYRERKRP